MRFALFSDVHGNACALKAVLEKIASVNHGEPVDRIYCLGDIITGHSSGEKVMALLDQYDVTLIQGNHDQKNIPFESINQKYWGMLNRTQAWEAEHISKSILDRLDQLPLSDTVVLADGRKMMLFHSNPQNLWDMTNSYSISQQQLMDNFVKLPADVLAYGHYHHTHLMMSRGKMLINVASVSSAVSYHEDDFARFTLVDSQKDRLIVLQEVVSYDWKSQELLDKKMQAPFWVERQRDEQ